MSREAFHHVLKRYLEGRCTEEEKKMAEQWYGLLDDETLPAIQPDELSAIDERLWNVVQAKMNESAPTANADEPVKTNASAPVRRLWPQMTVAASIVGLLMIMGYLGIRSVGRTPDFFSENAANSLIKKTNRSRVPVEVALEDGSTVRLQPAATLTYPRHFASAKREVFVQGEAFFQVQKNKSRPFYVHSNMLLVKVVGTSFVVRTNDQSQSSEVSVLTGKVMVSDNAKPTTFYRQLLTEKPEPVLLTPNQRVVYKKETKELTVTLVEKPVPVASTTKEEPAIVFNESPLSQVLPDLEKRYGIRITVENAAVYRCTFTGDLKNQQLYDQLDFICESVGASYQIKGTSILIEGGSCK